MRTWIHRLESEGKHLRSLIVGEESRENQAAIVKYLRVCCKRLMKQMKEEDYGYDEIGIIVNKNNINILFGRRKE